MLGIGGRRRTLVGLAVTVAVIALGSRLWLAAGAGASVGCTDNWTLGTSGDWGDSGGWTVASGADEGQHNIPGSTDIACWPAGTTLTVSSTDATATAGSIDGGDLDITTGGSLTLAASGGDSTIADLSISGPVNAPGKLEGPGALTLTGSFTFDGGTIGDVSPISINQTGGGSFQLGESGCPTGYLFGDTFTTSSPVTIGCLYVIPSGGSLTTTSTVNVAPGAYPTDAGTRMTISAHGYVLNGSSAPQDFNLIQTGGSTDLPAGYVFTPGVGFTLQAGTLAVDGTLGNGLTLTGGTAIGSGTIADTVTNTSGTVAPGDSFGTTLTIEGSYVQQTGGTLESAVTGTGAGQFNVLAVTGPVQLTGTLELDPTGGYAGSASPGDRLDVLSYNTGNSGATRTGTFSAVTSTQTLHNGDTFAADYSTANQVDAVVDAAVAPVNTAPPVVTGTAVVGDTLSTTTGTWTGSPTFSYQWEDCMTPPVPLRLAHVTSACNAISGATSSSYTLQSSDVGQYVIVIVTATVSPGNDSSAQGTPVKGPVTGLSAPGPVTGRTVTGTPLPGDTLTCNPGTWTGNPTFTYQWVLGKNPITGATNQTYTVTILDEGQAITCTIYGHNGAGVKAASTNSVVVAQKGTLHCPKPSGTLTGQRIGPLGLRETRTAARHALKRYAVTHYGFDDFCLYGGWGIRGAYEANKIVLLLTANPFYKLSGVTPGLTLTSVARRLKIGKVFVIGLNDWYVAPGAASNYVFKVRHGVIQEIGIANKRDTTGRDKQRTFLSGFKAA